MSARAAGFYWVRIRGGAEWTVVHWHGEYGETIGYDGPVYAMSIPEWGERIPEQDQLAGMVLLSDSLLKMPAIPIESCFGIGPVRRRVIRRDGVEVIAYGEVRLFPGDEVLSDTEE